MRREITRLSPLLLTVVIAGLAFATPEDVAVSHLMPAAPALAASMWTVAATVALGVLGVALVLVAHLVFHATSAWFTTATVAAVTAAAAYASHDRLLRERTLGQVRSVAEAAQAVVMRPLPRRIGRVSLETLYVAAAEEARVGATSTKPSILPTVSGW